MSKKIDNLMAKLEDARLPELRAKFEEVLGESTRAPNKVYLLRRIREGLEAKELAAKEARKKSKAPKEGKRKRESDGLTKLTVEELQRRYEQEVGRATGSDNSAYLIWKIRMARAGRIRVGPARERKHEPGTTQIVPLTLHRDTVAELDKVVEGSEHKSRSAFVKQAIHDYLRGQGNHEVAALFADAG